MIKLHRFLVMEILDQRNVPIKRVYHIEGLNHNLFSVGQLCDKDLEVAFRKSTCYFCDLKGNDLLTGSRGLNLYSITLQDTFTPNSNCFMAKPSLSQAWLWHYRVYNKRTRVIVEMIHVNFDELPHMASDHNAPPTLKDPKFWTAKEKKTQNIDHLARSLLIQGLPNDIYSLIDSNETAKDLWDALERQMRGFEYGEQDRKAAILYEYETFKAIEGEQLLDTYLRYLHVINDLKKCGYKKDNYVNDALGYKKKVVLVTSDPLALVTEKTNSANKKQEFVKTDEKKVEKKADEKKRDMNKVKCYNCKKEGHFAKDCNKAKEINANMVFMAQIEKVLLESDKSSSSPEETIAEVTYYTSEFESESEFKTLEYYDNSTNYGLFVNNDDDQEIFHDAIESASENFFENHIDSQKDYDKSEVDHNEYEEKEHLVDKFIQKFNHKIAKCQKHNLYNGRKGIGFENPSYFEKAKDLRHSLYDEKVIGLGYTPMFLTHSNEALEIEKFKRFRESKIEFAYDYRNLNASYVNEKINFEDDYFQEIINPDFEKIDSSFQQTSSLKPYVPNVILEKIIIDLEDEVVNLLEK
nr:integrase, catalytic region, zinc finger, CCHC-type, peptidase aspartic, catalytic [Tanacetum cinerariifolium]